MRRRWARLVLLMIGIGVGGACAPAPATAPAIGGKAEVGTASKGGEVVVTEARRILAAVHETKYAHRTHVNEADGIYDCDCSGLGKIILERVAPDAFTQIALGGHHRPLAIQFYETFAAAPIIAPSQGWQKIERIIDARPGDLIAWRKNEQKEGDTTGHVMIVNGLPEPDGEKLVKVEVIDSTSRAHAHDTRLEGQNGVGRGTVWFVVDDSGKPIIYRSKSAKGPSSSVPISIGRVIQ